MTNFPPVTHGRLYPNDKGSFKGYAYYFGQLSFKFVAKPVKSESNYYNLFLSGEEKTKRIGWMKTTQTREKVKVGSNIYEVFADLKFNWIDHVFTAYHNDDHVSFI